MRELLMIIALGAPCTGAAQGVPLRLPFTNIEQRSDQLADGEDPALMRTRYSVLYNRALEDLIDGDLHGDGVLFMRSGSIGNHNLPFSWAGDNESNFGAENGLPSVVLAGLNAGLSGSVDERPGRLRENIADAGR